MALDQNAQYPIGTAAPSADYPEGSAVNSTAPGALDGYPWEKEGINDLLGFQQALLRAGGVAANGNADTALASQYLQMIMEIASGRAGQYDDSGVADAYVFDVQANQQGPAGYFNGMRVNSVAGNTNTGASTVNVAGLGVVNIKLEGGVSDPAAGDIKSGREMKMVYRTSPSAHFELQQEPQKQIGLIDAVTSGGAITFTIKAGQVIEFRSTTLNDGSVERVLVTSDISMVLSSGSTLGMVNGIAARIPVLAINNAGTAEVAINNLAGGLDLSESGVISTTAEGGAGGADSANVIYSTTARANVAYKVMGFIDLTEAVAGTHDTNPTLIQGAGGNAVTALSPTAKAWVNFNGSGTVAIRGQFNVSSITDNGVGDYTANFTNAMNDTNYCAVGNNGVLGASSTRTTNPHTMSTSNYRFEATGSTTGALTDADVIMLSIFAN